MVDQDISRKLAVIVHADVVDSTGLVQRDEILAHKRITEAFQRFFSIIQDYGQGVDVIEFALGFGLGCLKPGEDFPDGMIIKLLCHLAVNARTGCCKQEPDTGRMNTDEPRRSKPRK